MAVRSACSSASWLRQAGHDLDFSAVTRERMIRASIAGNEQNDSGTMRRLFIEISDPARVAALTRAIEALDRHGFAWNDSYVATAEPGHTIEVVMAGVAGGQFVARTATEILVGQVSDLPKLTPQRGDTFTLVPTAWRDE